MEARAAIWATVAVGEELSRSMERGMRSEASSKSSSHCEIALAVSRF